MVKEFKPIKVCTETHGKILRVLGEIQQHSNERITMEKVILKLLDFWNNGRTKNEKKIID